MPAYSHSQLSTYETCPHQYRLSYIDKIRVETEGIEAFMGSRVHEALEKLYRDLKVTRLNSIDEIVDFYHQCWEKNWNDSIQIVRKEYSAEDYRRLGAKCVTDYYKRYHPFDQGKSLGLEENIFFLLEEEKGYWIRGIVDRLTLVNDSILEIHDYKTSGRLPTEEEVSSDRQLALYQMGVERRWKDIREVRLIWHYLSFDTEIRSSRSSQELHQLRQKVLGLIQKIEGDTQFLPKEGPLCNWCDYHGLCPRKKHFVTVGKLAPNEYLQEGGVTLVNRYVDLKEKKRLLNEEIDTEIAKLEEALLAYAQKEKVETIWGGDHMIRIKNEIKERYPLKSDFNRKALDDLIKKAGRWMEVSDLNPWMLARAISRGTWPEALAKKVKEFSTMEESQSIVLSKLKEQD